MQASQDALVGTALLLAGVPAAHTLRIDGDRLRPAELEATLGPASLEIVRVDAEGVHARVVTALEPGSYVVALRSASGRWRTPGFQVLARPPADGGAPEDLGGPPADAGPVDGGGLDAAPDDGVAEMGVGDAAPEDDAGLDAGAPGVVVNGRGTPVRVPGVDVPDRCETDPALSTDGAFLFLAQPTTSFCLGERRFRIFRWNDGAPTDTGALLGDANYRRVHPFDGALLGLPGGYGMLAELGGNIVRGRLAGDPPRFERTPAELRTRTSSPSLTLDGSRMIYGEGTRLFEVTDPFGAAAPVRELTGLAGTGIGEATVSADGLVLVYVAVPRLLADPDLYVATRRSQLDLFTDAAPLPEAEDRINTDATELGPFLTAEGDLLFTSTRNDNDRELFRVPGFYVP